MRVPTPSDRSRLPSSLVSAASSHLNVVGLPRNRYPNVWMASAISRTPLVLASPRRKFAANAPRLADRTSRSKSAETAATASARRARPLVLDSTMNPPPRYWIGCFVGRHGGARGAGQMGAQLLTLTRARCRAHLQYPFPLLGSFTLDSP